MRHLVRLSFAALAAVLAPTFVYAQASINGLVKDSSGALLPGVTVEASSPALIEKVRTAVTDRGGQYHIEDLRPGTYAITFSLTGFSTIKREGIELSGSFTATVNADMKVGAVAETIIVTGETPVVDVVNAKQLQTVSAATLDAIPTARLYHSIATLVPGVSVSGSQDVGGLAGPVTVTFNMRGGPGNEGRLTLDGLSLGASLNGTGVSYTVADVPNAQEIVFTTAGGLGELEVGGPAMNLVPRQGGNKYSGSFFGNWANESLQTSNYTDAINVGSSDGQGRLASIQWHEILPATFGAEGQPAPRAARDRRVRRTGRAARDARGAEALAQQALRRSAQRADRRAGSGGTFSQERSFSSFSGGAREVTRRGRSRLAMVDSSSWCSNGLPM